MNTMINPEFIRDFLLKGGNDILSKEEISDLMGKKTIFGQPSMYEFAKLSYSRYIEDIEFGIKLMGISFGSKGFYIGDVIEKTVHQFAYSSKLEFIGTNLIGQTSYHINGQKYIFKYGNSTFLQNFISCLIQYNEILIDHKDRSDKQRLEELQVLEKQRLKELQVSQTNVLSDLDKDGNGEVDVVEGNDFNTLLKKHQKTIVEVDRNYVQQFVKVSSYLKTKKGNIQSIFNSIKDTPNQEVLNEYVEILKGEIHTYNLVLFNSLNMIVSLVEDDMITFYEIYEMFDTINMFDSKHEKDVSQKLTNIGDGLKSLMHEIRVMGNKITNSIQELSYVTEQSNQQLTEQLSEIDSTMKVGNLISTINTYQNYKINKNTKSLRG
jgi:hypothetical protein